MKIQEIANKYGFRDLQGMSDFAKENYPNDVKVKLFPGETKISDAVVNDFVESYTVIARAKDMLVEEEARLAEIARTMPITSSANFEGYRITRYGGYVSGDEVATIPMGYFTGLVTDNDVNETIKKVRAVAIQELKMAAANIGCNAIIGLDFDYITLESNSLISGQGAKETRIVLTANGTAVEIEPL